MAGRRGNLPSISRGHFGTSPRRGRFGTSHRQGYSGARLTHLALLVAAIILIGGLLVAYQRLAAQAALDPDTLCPVGEAPAGTLAILVDISRPIMPAQAQQIRRAVDDAILEMPLTSEVALGFVTPDPTGWGPRFRACRPPSRNEVDPRIRNPRHAEERFQSGFSQPLENALETVIGRATIGSEARLALERGLGRAGVALIDTGGEIIATLPDSITFEAGSDRLNADLARILVRLGEELAAVEGLAVTLIGHTDSTGPRGVNEALSRSRAEAVADALRQGGMPQSRLAARGEADDQPVAPNDTEAGRAANRRVEMVIAGRSPIMEALQALASETGLATGGRSGGPRRLLLVSDLLQHSEAISLYEGGWSDFVASPHHARLARNLHGVEVEILRIPRVDAGSLDTRDIDHFWTRYLDYQGATVSGVRTIGDL